MTARILVVDDEADLEALVLQKFRRQIRTGAVSFLFAHDGVEALSTLRARDGIELRVSDEGRGLPADFQIGQSESLGMKVIASTATQHGGKLEVNRLEKGTEFLIRLPPTLENKR